MNIIEFNKKEMLSGAYPIGMGKTAICWATSHDEVFKIYMQNKLGQQLTQNPNFAKKLERISTISNETYIGPTAILLSGQKLVGCVYPLINAPTLASIPPTTTIKELFDSYEKLIISTRAISDQHFKLYDARNKNILFNGSYYVIDLDMGVFDDTASKDQIFDSNIGKIFRTILKNIYDINPSHAIEFSDKDINLIYHHMSKSSMEDIETLQRIFADKCKSPNPTIKQIKSKVKAKGVNLGYNKKDCDL